MKTFVPERPLVTLTTDFGTRDPYVAAMKGVLKTQCPRVEILDLTHGIAPGNRTETALFLASAMPYFPPWTIHVVVVDPGVGTERLALAALAGGQVFLVPDNGVLSLYLQQVPLDGAWAIVNQTFMRDVVSPTFHGRDVFAVAAGCIASGASLSAAGPRVEQLTALELPEVRHEAAGTLVGEIIHIDRFGNAITNVRRKDLTAGPSYRAAVGGHSGLEFAETYGRAPKGTPLALWGGSDRLELAVTDGNAAEKMALAVGMPVTVYDAGPG